MNNEILKKIIEIINWRVVFCWYASKNGTFEGTVLYNSDEHSIHKVGNFRGDWFKTVFKEIEQVTLTFVS